jgi:hypothetical protein
MNIINVNKKNSLSKLEERWKAKDIIIILNIKGIMEGILHLRHIHHKTLVVVVAAVRVHQHLLIITQP